MDKLSLPVWVLLLLPPAWLIFAPALALWCALLLGLLHRPLGLSCSRSGVLRFYGLCLFLHLGGAACTLFFLFLVPPVGNSDWAYAFPGQILAALPGFLLSIRWGHLLLHRYAFPDAPPRACTVLALLAAPWVLFASMVSFTLPPPLP